MRIQNHPILQFPREHSITFFYNSSKVNAFEGESIAAALHAHGVSTLSESLHFHRPRGFFCGIGKCSSCFMTVDTIPNVRTCITPVQNGMRVQTQQAVGALHHQSVQYLKKKELNTDIVVVGCGPAGMMAALAAANQGARVLVFDENHKLGGQLIKQTHKFFGSQEEKAGDRGVHIASSLIEQVQNHENITVYDTTTVVGYYPQENTAHSLLAVKRYGSGEQRLDITTKCIIFACGAMENFLAFPGNDLPGVYGAGGVQTLMNVYGIKPGNNVLMVGAGNVGLIVSYQLLQAGVHVDRVVEALPRIGGYHVHAAKLRRCGVPIYTSHSILEALGQNKVEGAKISAIDDQFQPITGTEEIIECDTICLAVGLTPSIRLLQQAGVKTEYIPEAGGLVAIHDDIMQTLVPNIYVAGDSSGIEEASTAMIEGELAGVSAAASLGYTKHAQKLQDQCKHTLQVFRSGPFGQTPRICKEKIACCQEGGTLY